jgi:hypothetical protein
MDEPVYADAESKGMGATSFSAAGLVVGLTALALATSAQAETLLDQIPRPVGVLVPKDGVVWFGVFNLTLMATVFTVMLWIAWRTRSVLPLFFLAGGALGGLVEPVFDGNIHVQFAEQGQPPNWFFYNVGYPWYVIPGNAMLGGPVYLMFRRFQQGISNNQLRLAFVGWWMFNNCWEVPGTHIGAYAYYGPHPFKFLGYPLWIGMMAGLGIPLAGFTVYAAAKVMNGPMLCLTTIVLIPIAIYGSEVITWPMWLALNGGIALETTPWLVALSLVFVLVGYNLLVRTYASGRDSWATA